MINVYKSPESANDYANFFIPRIPDNVENVCLLFIGHLETVYNILAAKPDVHFTVIDGSDTIDALPYIYNGSNLKESITFEDDWCENSDTLIENLQTIFNNMSFDLIIANPPFQVGNKVIQFALQVAKKSVFLVPSNSLEAKGVYKNVKEFTLIDVSLFSDAFLSRNTGIAILEPTYKLGNIERLKDLTRDPSMLPIYSYIREHSPTYKNYLYAAKASRPELNINPKTWFKVTHQAVIDGVHSTDPANDRDWNINGKDTESYDGSNCIFYDMGSEKAKANITHWWYYKGKKGLANALLLGLRKRLTTNKEMMPCINWSKDVDYTDEYVLSEMGFKLVDPLDISKGVKKI